MTRVLEGARVLVTRRYEDSRELASGIQRRGGRVACIPMIEVVGPSERDTLASARERVGEFDWLVFTSRNSARSFLEGTERIQGDRPKVAVVGEATGAAVRACGWSVDFKSEGKGAADLARALVEGDLVAGRTFLHPCSNLVRFDFSSRIMASGASGVMTVEAYRIVKPVFAQEELDPHDHDIFVFASPSAVSHMTELLDRERGLANITAVSIGPATSQALEENGATSVFEAETTDHKGLLAATEAAWAQHNKKGVEADELSSEQT